MTYPDDTPDSTLVHTASILVGKNISPWVQHLGVNDPLLCIQCHPTLFCSPHNPMSHALEGNQNWEKELPKSPQVIKPTPKFQPRYSASVARAASAGPHLFPHFVKYMETWGKGETPQVLDLWCFLSLELKPWGKLAQIPDCESEQFESAATQGHPFLDRASPLWQHFIRTIPLQQNCQIQQPQARNIPAEPRQAAFWCTVHTNTNIPQMFSM